MKKRILLIILLIFLCLSLLSLTLFKFVLYDYFFDNESKDKITNEEKLDVDEIEYVEAKNNTAYFGTWKSYKTSIYDQNDFLEGSSDNFNYSLEINDSYFKICTLSSNNCSSSSYHLENDKYIFDNSDLLVIKTGFEAFNDNDEIHFIKQFDDTKELLIFYFKKNIE